MNSTPLNVLYFADNTTFYQSNSHIDDLINNMNHELKQLYAWFCANKLSLNVKKTNIVALLALRTTKAM